MKPSAFIFAALVFLSNPASAQPKPCDYSYIDEAIDAAVAIGGPVRLTFPTGLYKVDTALGYYTGDDVIIDFNGSTLDFSAAATNTLGPLLGFQGTYGATGSTGFGIRTSGACSYLSVTGNTAYYSNTGITTTVGVSFGGTTTYSGAWNNVTEGFGTNVNVGAGTGVVSANNI